MESFSITALRLPTTNNLLHNEGCSTIYSCAIRRLRTRLHLWTKRVSNNQSQACEWEYNREREVFGKLLKDSESEICVVGSSEARRMQSVCSNNAKESGG